MAFSRISAVPYCMRNCTQYIVLMSYSYNDKAFCVLLFADMNKLVIVFALVALVAAAHANYYPLGGYGKFGGGFNNIGRGRFFGGVGQLGGGFAGQGGAFINQGFGGVGGGFGRVGGGFGRVGGGFGGNKYYY